MIWLRSALYWLGMLVVTPPYALLCFLILPLPPLLRYKVVSRWSRIMIFWLRVTCGVKYRVIGRENVPDVPVMVMSKHQSAWETMALQELLPPLVFVVKRELLKIPFFGWGLRTLSPIAIDRGNRSEAQKMLMAQGTDRLGKGFSILIFPEGTRVPAGQRGKYRQGGARLANELHVPILPVALNSGEFWPRNSFLKWPGTVTVCIGKPIPTANRAANEIMAEVEYWIENQMAAITERGPKYPRDAAQP
ncbi:1-acyl-sn-glycerol-3-phosphate acyltransferase [Andreprevotia lacus DSM 23236]|jgi:1-acyl-sn-glycerol-3-phosphate acyltransferase|uniref:1-acyl-sn-glycerol-3-phosphate acyltransferase n=1 Tax=Andreprevotia lacus DSM 23236 TaxID=1121001 RepID=A0A1W1XS72_9NEIS|nr:lysophospholipid acyltransferase family protein [Andreprevotia lacus]SMC26820.1 1-acyl-sn-glycerol-3-phosphate acyltransferase [Andreprevotia lacus DSM 23236]